MMPLSVRFSLLPAALIFLTLLTACQSTEEKAAGHFASAQELLAEGDTPRALVELRNAVALLPEFHEARNTLARTLLDSGDLAGAYAQFSELADLQPNDLESRIALATIMLSQSLWVEYDEIVSAAQRINGTDPRVIALILARDYQNAVVAGNDIARASIARQANTLRAMRPDDPALVRIAIDQAIAGDAPQESLPLIDAALAAQPQDFRLQETKLRLLLAQDEPDKIIAQYRTMIAVFPTDEQIPASFLQWYLSRQDLAGAEAFLRERAGDATAPVEGHVTLIEFLRGTKGPEAALAEITPLIDANTDDPDDNPKAHVYRALRASINFDTGAQEPALAEIAEVLASATPSDQTRRIKALYATMLDSTGDRPGAEGVVAEILAEDASHVDALVLRAGWRVAVDRASDAIIDLRTALSQAPNDARVLWALAQAYLRDGSIELATETISRAVDLAPQEPAYAREYVRLLQDQGRTETARAVLYKAWQSNPADIALVQALSSLAVAESDWTLAAEIIGLLQSTQAPLAVAAAVELESAVLLAQERYDDAIAVIDRQLANADADKAAWILAKVDALMRADRAEDATATLSAALEETPDSRFLLHRRARLELEQGRPDQAIATYRAVLELDPADQAATRELYTLLEARDQTAEAAAVLEAGLALTPQSLDLRWLQATRLETAGDIAGAIAIYEPIYAENGANPVIANNLASLLSQTATDPETIDRAYRIARRFRASQNPAFQDTYGWLLHLTGDSAAALPILESAVASLPEVAAVQFHYGSVLAALNQTDAAKTALERSIALSANPDDPYVARATALIEELSKPAPQP